MKEYFLALSIFLSLYSCATKEHKNKNHSPFQKDIQKSEIKKNYDSPDQSHEKRALFIYTSYESFNRKAFDIEESEELIHKLENNDFSVNLRYVESYKEIPQIIESFSGKNLTFVILGAHGNSYTMQFKDRLTVDTIKEIGDAFKALKKYNTTIILKSCSTGKECAFRNKNNTKTFSI